MYCPDCGQEISDYATVCNHCGRPIKPSVPGVPMGVGGLGTQETVASFASKKIAAGVCGILLGSLGVHKFVLGLTKPGVIMLLITVLTCGLGGIVTSVIGLIEGIVYLTKSDQEFYQTYAVEKKGWF